MISEALDAGSCRTVDPDMMQPEGRRALNKARDVCAGCPMEAWSDCLQKALTLPAGHVKGVWASTTQRQRQGLRKKKRAGTLPPMEKLRRQLESA